MRTMIAIAIAFSASFSLAATTDADQELALKKMRETYSGNFTQDIDGQARSFKADGKTVVQLEGDIAKSLLYDIVNAKEQLQYVKREGGASWMNYYIRTGYSIRCAHGSYDLLADQFPKIRCRLSVDANGIVHAFGDRIEGRAEWHKDKNMDLMYGKIEGSVGPSNTYNFIKSQNPDRAVTVQIFGKPAQEVYDAMTNVKVTDESMGPIPTKMKRAKQIWCAKMGAPDGFSNDDQMSTKCRIVLSSKGLAVEDTP